KFYARDFCHYAGLTQPGHGGAAINRVFKSKIEELSRFEESEMKISETYTVRSAQPADATGLHRLIADLAGYQGQRHEVKLSADQLQEQLASQDCPFECLVAQTGDELVGFALFFQTYSTWEGKRGIYLEDFFVNDEMRGRGVGQALLRELARIALE